MLRLLGGVNKAVPPCHCRGAAPCLGFELLGGLLDGGAFVGGLDGAEQGGLGGDLVDGPSFWLPRSGLRGMPASIGQRLCTFNIGPVCAGNPPTIATQWSPSTTGYRWRRWSDSPDSKRQAWRARCYGAPDRR